MKSVKYSLKRRNMNLEPEYKEKIIGILTVLFPDAKIYLFGSRARGTHSEKSDIDIAIDEGKEIRPGRIGEAINMFAESRIPYKVDVVDFHGISEKMQYFIKKEGIL
ncbi:nucleotidyltransferase family protein [Candidatus Dependentiae bacterium]